jgi:nitrogen fixation/metabolism regulation signal transduction histidine kinase
MQTNPWSLLFVCNLILLVLLVILYPAVDPGSEAHAITLVSVGIIGVSIIGLSIVIAMDWRPFTGAGE